MSPNKFAGRVKRAALRSLLVGLIPTLAFPLWSAVSPAERARTVEITIRHSRFRPAIFQFEAGSVVRFLVRNTDPIDHELIIGDGALQLRHENGTEAQHGDVPGEVSISAGEIGETTYRFTKRGALIMGCHAPGHYDYGMKGEIQVQ